MACAHPQLSTLRRSPAAFSTDHQRQQVNTLREDFHGCGSENHEAAATAAMIIAGTLCRQCRRDLQLYLVSTPRNLGLARRRTWTVRASGDCKVTADLADAHHLGHARPPTARSRAQADGDRGLRRQPTVARQADARRQMRQLRIQHASSRPCSFFVRGAVTLGTAKEYVWSRQSDGGRPSLAADSAWACWLGPVRDGLDLPERRSRPLPCRTSRLMDVHACKRPSFSSKCAARFEYADQAGEYFSATAASRFPSMGCRRRACFRCADATRPPCRVVKQRGQRGLAASPCNRCDPQWALSPRRVVTERIFGFARGGVSARMARPGGPYLPLVRPRQLSSDPLGASFPIEPGALRLFSSTYHWWQPASGGDSVRIPLCDRCAVRAADLIADNRRLSSM